MCEWISHLKSLDGYISNLAHCVDMEELRMHGMKSYDCHVFMQKLILVVFCEMLPEHVWSALTEVNLLLQIICSKTLDVNKVQELKGTSRSTNGESDDESDEDSFDEDYETKEDNNYN
ncbi:UNVERIFIED_CONTAM: hypothetical protein Scaly_2689000 [Sesamum calycinum]|uniref:Uncharacterized protein n=1 Tax=Sesamum calycinum TaxID=2727403 RepID=A0AAW2J5N8_9LAMI